MAVAVHVFQTIPKIEKAVSIVAASGIEAVAVIGDGNTKAVVDNPDAEADFAGAAVPDGIVESFFYREKKMVAHFSGNDLLRK